MKLQFDANQQYQLDAVAAIWEHALIEIAISSNRIEDQEVAFEPGVCLLTDDKTIAGGASRAKWNRLSKTWVSRVSSP